MVTAQPSANRLSGTALPEATDKAIPTPELAPTTRAASTFTLYAYQGHLYASNVRGKLIELGTLTQGDNGGGCAYAIDGDDRPDGSGFASAQEALQEVARGITFLYLDGQFTAQRDLSDVHRPDLPDAPQVRVTLDPLGHANPAVEAAP